jgi:hypothetical protein
MIQVKFYTPDLIEEWNNFLCNSKGQTFMFCRSFMDYHSDKFVDRSLLVYEENEIVAIIPASLNQDKVSLTSHSGLTFGSFIVKEKLRTYKTIEYFYHTLKFLSENSIKHLFFKQIPSFYTSISTDEIDYAFFILEAELYRMDIAYAINFENQIPYQERRSRNIKKGIKNDIKITKENDFSNFWNEILTPNLNARFGVNPVHSLHEITSLSKNNLGSIIQFNAYKDGQIMAGTTLFETPNVIHAQYISASEEGRKNGSLDLLFDYLINEYSKSKKYLDFGIVNEEMGRKINLGLLDWKEGFGARAYAHRFYKTNTMNFKKLEKLLYI